MFPSVKPSFGAAALALGALLTAPAAPAQPEVTASYGKWQLLKLADGEQCDIRSREIDSDDDDTPPRLYLVGNGDPDRPFDIRLDSGGDDLDPARIADATLAVDEKTAKPAYANLLDPRHLSLTANIRELKLGGQVTVTAPLTAGGERHYTFSLIGFTAAYRQLGECSPPADTPSLAAPSPAAAE